jgi:hypothetical protein
LAPPHKLLPYPCPICSGKFGTAQIVVFNGVLRHGTKHPDYRYESRDYTYMRMHFLDSVRDGEDRLYTCYKNNFLFRIYHYSPEKYNNVKKQMKPIWKNPRKIKKAYGKEVHSFRTEYEIKYRYKIGTKTYLIPPQDIFLDPDHFNLKRNQRSKSWSLNENSKGKLMELYEMIKQDGWRLREPMPTLMDYLGLSRKQKKNL